MPDIERLYREHRAGLVRLVERELQDRQDAEDVVQTAFLDAQHALARGTIPHNPRAWLAAIALNAARRLRRRHAPVNVGPLEEYAVEEALRLPEIKAALAGLPKNEQAAVLYRDLIGLSYAETAAEMGTTVPAVTMLLHRARSRLRGRLGIALVGVGRWRWLRGDGSEASVVSRAAGVVVLAGGLATAGVATVSPAVRASRPAAARVTTVAAQQGVEPSTVRVGRAAGGAEGAAAAAPQGRARGREGPPPASQPPPSAPGDAPAASSGEAAPADATKAAAPVPKLPLPVLPVPTPSADASTPTVTTPAPAAPAVAALPSSATTVSTPVTTLTVSVP